MKYLLCAIWISLLCGCDHPQQKYLLREAGRLLETSPDSALSVLKQVRPDGLSRAQQAQYALLFVEAQDKNGKDMLSDTLLWVAMNYYAGRGNSLALAKCYYYQGCYYWELEEWTETIKSYGEAESIALHLKEYNLLGLIYSRLARLYTRQLNIDEALSTYEKCIACFKKSGNIKNEAIALGNKGRTFLYHQQYDSTLYYLELAEKLHRNQRDTQALNVCLNVKAYLWLRLGHTDQAKKMIDPDKMTPDQYALLGDICSMEGKLDSAEYYMHLALKSVHNERQQLGFYQSLADIAYAKEDYKKAVHYLNQRCVLTDSVYQNFVENSVEKWRTSSRYERAQKEVVASKLEAVYFQRLLAIASIVFLIVVSVYQFLHSRKRKKLYEYRFLIQQLQISEANLKNLLERQLEEKSVQLQAFFQKRVNILKKLIDIAKCGNEKLQTKLADISLSPEDWQLLQEGLNTSMDGIVDYIAKTYPALTEDDRKYCYLHYAGFSAQEIAILLNLRLDSIYKKRNRIRQRLHLESDVSLEDFLEELRRKLSRKQVK